MCVAVCCTTIWNMTSSMMHDGASRCCSVLQCVAVLCCSMFHDDVDATQHCNTLQHDDVEYDEQQHHIAHSLCVCVCVCMCVSVHVCECACVCLREGG